MKISICIPAYQRPENIKRLLQSIAVQTFRDLEVVITDDSPDDSVKNVLQEFSILPVHYIKNETALGTPSNWNYAISKAKGEWIKLMHDDDWFADENSLQIFADATGNRSPFIFSDYTNVFESGRTRHVNFPSSWKKRIVEQPLTLMAQNVIGPPSVTMVHHSVREQYDTFMKWRVDIDFYIRILKEYKSFTHIDKPLINVGISNSQVTNSCFNMPEVELPEGLLMLSKYGVKPLKHLLVYDAWWRTLRNVNTRNEKQLMLYTPHDRWPEVIKHMVRHEALIPAKLLKNGIVSKLSMFASYVLNQKRLSH